MHNERVWIYADGACSGNPGPGGWGAILKHPLHTLELAGHHSPTTNNRMELTAVAQGLREVISRGWTLPLCVVSDSQYVVKGITEWVFQWQRNGWRTSQRTEVGNRDLWEELVDLQIQIKSQVPELVWQWVRGHQGHVGNEAADQLAQKALREAALRL